MIACKERPKTTYRSYADYPVYTGTDLGLTYTAGRSVFKLWAPTAEAVQMLLYTEGEGGQPTRTQAMEYGGEGVWKAAFEEDLLGQFYAFQVKINGEWSVEAPDPYAKAVGVNGERGMVVDLKTTNPKGWAQDRQPTLQHKTDAVIYELHVRDLSSDPNSGIRHTGKFLGLTEGGTKSAEGEMTGLDHLKDLGVTHIHLLPAFDYKSIDERIANNPNYNWGYDPQNFNTPEGSYATDPYDGNVRIREFKQMVKTLHENGLRVVMDVVYNHTYQTEESLFEQLVPGYYFRQNPDGTFSNASGTGNETASERPMVRKFIIESLKYWVQEYHIDGFRFDLMAIHDQETMNRISKELHQLDPTILLYGEGWTAGDSPLPEAQRSLKQYISKIDRVAAFSNDIRDALKGHVFEHTQKGFISGLPGQEETVKFGIVASVNHPQIRFDTTMRYSQEPWAAEPHQCITYVEAHDNHTLWDRLLISAPEADEAQRVQMHKLASAIVLTSQGISFLHAGQEFLRTKNGDENSYKSPDSVNRLDWSRKAQYKDEYNYVKGLIALRKNHPAFRMSKTEDIVSNLKFLKINQNNLVGYLLTDHANGDKWRTIVVVFNGNRSEKSVTIPDGEWTQVVDGEQVNEAGIRPVKGGKVTIPAISAMILVQ